MKTPRSKNTGRDYVSMGKRIDQGSDKFVLRLPDGMRDFIAHMAELNGRSMNAEIVNALAHQTARSNLTPPAAIRHLVREALAENIRQGFMQMTLRDMGQELLKLADQLDESVKEAGEAAKEAVLAKKNPPA